MCFATVASDSSKQKSISATNFHDEQSLAWMWSSQPHQMINLSYIHQMDVAKEQMIDDANLWRVRKEWGRRYLLYKVVCCTWPARFSDLCGDYLHFFQSYGLRAWCGYWSNSLLVTRVIIILIPLSSDYRSHDEWVQEHDNTVSEVTALRETFLFRLSWSALLFMDKILVLSRSTRQKIASYIQCSQTNANLRKIPLPPLIFNRINQVTIFIICLSRTGSKRLPLKFQVLIFKGKCDWSARLSVLGRSLLYLSKFFRTGIWM